MQKPTPIWHWLFLLLIATLPFQTLLQFQVGNTAVQISDLLVPIAGIAWLFDNTEKKSWNIFYSLLAIFIVAMAISAVFSSDPAISRIKLPGKILLAAVAFLSFNFVRSSGLLFLVRVWTGASFVLVLACVLGIIAFYLGTRDPEINLVVHPIFGSLPAGNYPRIEGFSKFPAILCNYLSISWWLAMAASSALWFRSRISWLFRPILLIADIFTLTPGLGGFLLSNSIFLGQRIKETRRIAGHLVAAAGVLAATAVLAASILTLFAYTPDGPRVPILNGEIVASHRVAAWLSGLETFGKHPLFGVGIGVPTATAIYTDPNGNRQLLAEAHNTYINVLAESGIAGFIAFFTLVVWSARRSLGVSGADPKQNAIRFCLALAMLDSFFFQGLTGSYEDQRHIWALLGIIAAFDPHKQIES